MKREEIAQTYFIKSSDFTQFLQKLTSTFELYVPKKTDKVLHYQFFDSESFDDILVGEVRPSEPLKSFFFPAKEKVGTYFGQRDIPEERKPLALLGVKSCDLHSLRVYDAIVGEGDFIDPTYKRLRESSLIIASDCISALDTCFCALVDVNPYPESNFDLSLSPLADGYLVEIGSERGSALVGNESGFSSASDEQIQTRNKKRGMLKKTILEKNRDYQINGRHQELLNQGYASPVWKKTTETCVECGACNLVCPTCYCFLLSDEKRKEGFARMRGWDGCQYTGFARVAGGANPRRKLYERLRYRYLHKFDLLKKTLGFYACTGCGRCIGACMGKIDMRKVFKELA